MKENFKVFDKAKDIPNEWNDFCKDNFFMQKDRLEFLENVNPCNQKYYIVYNKQNIEACFVMFPFKYEFDKHLKINVKLIFLPVSVADPGIVAKPNSKELYKCLKKIKGIKLILSTSEDFKLINGIKFEGNPNCRLDIKWNDLDQYLNNMRTKYRSQMKEILRKREKLDIRILKDNSKEFTNEIYQLYMQVMSNVDYVLETLNIEFFRNNFSKTMVYEVNKKPKAFMQFIEDDKKIICEFCGFDYKDRDKFDLYKNTLLGVVIYAIENGYKEIDVGQSAEMTKMKFGAYLEPKYSWIFYNGNKICNKILEYILLNKNTHKEKCNYNIFKKSSNIK